MKSYLSLIPISAKVYRRQNRMTLLCIVFAVFMVTAVFSMAEMGARMEYMRLLGKHGKLSMTDLFGSYMGQSLLLVACVLFLLILIAGVLMISSSMNSTIAQRIQFFGMMRCIGMSKQQIVRFVRLEALNWCKTAVPVGLALGVVTTWVLCAVLRFLVGEEFSNIPLFGVSVIGIVCGILVGVVTVLLAANAPAKRASKVSPITAVSGNADNKKTIRHTSNTRFGRIETILGINHAVSMKKDLIMMTSSFALSIILFLSFSVVVDFANYLMPQSASTSDIDIASDDGNTIPHGLLVSIQGMDGVKEVYGRRSAFDLPASVNGDTSVSDAVDLISYDDFDLQSLKKDGNLKKGSDLSKVYGDSSYVLATSDADSTWKIGDTVQLGGETLTIAGLLKNDPFSGDGLTNGKITLISSGHTFVRLTGEENYSLVMVRTTSNATDEDVQAVQTATGETFSFRDKRDEHTTGTYMAFVFCVYAFLAIVALVTVLNIVNSISMSVSARMKQYGVMRAVGMDEQQVTKMIAAEAATYATSGCIVGCIVGLPLSKLLYDFLIANHFPYAAGYFPKGSLVIILLFVSFAVIVAVRAPAKRIHSMLITATINEL
ncbi:ABC transporter permease [Clostridiales bacterium]|nr:ABC transporter permease [Clostridiales bacterium]